MTIKSSLQEHAQIFQWGTRKNTNVYSRMGIPYFWIPYQEYQSLSGIPILVRNTNPYQEYQLVQYWEYQLVGMIIRKTSPYRVYQTSSEIPIFISNTNPNQEYQFVQDWEYQFLGIIIRNTNPCEEYQSLFEISFSSNLNQEYQSFSGIPII